MDQEAKHKNINSNLKGNQDANCMKHWTRVQFWNIEVCEQKNNL
jgi:hypothetical protein